jgi:hypothetical protein
MRNVVKLVNLAPGSLPTATGEDGAAVAAEVLLPASLFAHLGFGLDVDPGTSSPNPASEHLLRRLLPSSSYAAMKRRAVELAGGGMMFLWAQLLAGMDFPTNADEGVGQGRKIPIY